MEAEETVNALGLSRDVEAVYRAMVAHPDEGLRELGARLSCSEQSIRSALDVLHELALIRELEDTPSRYRAVPPQIALKALLTEQEERLRAEQARFERAELAAAELISDLAPATLATPAPQLVGIHDIRDYIKILAESVTSELMTFAPGGGHSAASLEAARPQDQALLRRGVRMRTIYLDSIRNHQPTLGYAGWLYSTGAEVRTAPTLPVRMMIMDRKYAVVPMLVDDSSEGAVVLSGSGVLSALCALFESVWDTASPLNGGAARSRSRHGLTTQSASVLKMLAQGCTDEVIAKRLGVSPRTVRRIASELMEQLGARSRFQAGVRAASRGWLTGEE